jgi:hypothetical protein
MLRAVNPLHSAYTGVNFALCKYLGYVRKWIRGFKNLVIYLSRRVNYLNTSTYPYIHSFTHSLTHSFTHPLIHSFIYLFTHSFTHSLIHSFIHSFSHSLIHLLTHSLIHSFLHSFIHSFIQSFIHLAVCLTAGSKPLPKRTLYIVRSRASSFRCEYPLLSVRSSSSFLYLLLRLPVTSIPPFIFPSITCRRSNFYAKCDQSS